ncbi:unnamed protein product [Phytomonas sp. EM1]|nr:unnamed protein product [Phytomonas sp. EM1]|eukprot:CCW60224.1 unnamed protein product [Phytomonas sp. isolate EM1]
MVHPKSSRDRIPRQQPRPEASSSEVSFAIHHLAKASRREEKKRMLQRQLLTLAYDAARRALEATSLSEIPLERGKVEENREKNGFSARPAAAAAFEEPSSGNLFTQLWAQYLPRPENEAVDPLNNVKRRSNSEEKGDLIANRKISLETWLRRLFLRPPGETAEVFMGDLSVLPRGVDQLRLTYAECVFLNEQNQNANRRVNLSKAGLWGDESGCEPRSTCVLDYL